MGLWVCKQRQPIFLEPFHVPHANATVLPAKDTTHPSPLIYLGMSAVSCCCGRFGRGGIGQGQPQRGWPPLHLLGHLPGDTEGPGCTASSATSWV